MKAFLWPSLLLGTALCAGCGGGGSGGSSSADSGAGDDVSISSFRVYGTSATGSDGAAPINPYVNDGEWTFEWSTDFAFTYRVDFYLSTDSTLTIAPGGPDARILGRNCAANQSILMVCGFTGQAICTLDGNNKSFCTLAGETGNLSKEVASLQTFLDTVPKDAYLILRMCDAAGLRCDQRAVRVRFE